MITPKANGKLITLLAKMAEKGQNKTEELAVLIAASNVLITDITGKGELILEHSK